MPPKAKDPAPDTIFSDASESATSGEAGLDAGLAAAPIWIGIDHGRAERPEDVFADFARQLPKLTALLERARANGVTPSILRVNSHTDGFRRAGMRHPFGVSSYPLDHFDPAQIEIMLGEPALTVELV